MEKTSYEKERGKNPWKVISILSLGVILLSIFFLVFSEMTFDVTMENSGSSLTLKSLDENAQGGAHFSVQRTFFDEVWFGILGLFCAWGLKKKDKFAWKLGVFWSVMLLTVGIVMAVYQVGILGWATPCLMMISLTLFGGIALTSLLRVKREFT
jgi:hypothetical protein